MFCVLGQQYIQTNKIEKFFKFFRRLLSNRFILLRSEISNPESILVLLTNDLVAIDCRATGLPSYENPYAMDFQVNK